MTTAPAMKTTAPTTNCVAIDRGNERGKRAHEHLHHRREELMLMHLTAFVQGEKAEADCQRLPIDGSSSREALPGNDPQYKGTENQARGSPPSLP
jgi:hypothetical protein